MIKFIPCYESKKEKLLRILKDNDISIGEALVILNPSKYNIINFKASNDKWKKD